jgi:hypothetical protein
VGLRCVSNGLVSRSSALTGIDGMLLAPRLEHYRCAANYRKTVALGFRPRHRAPLARPRANDSASSFRSSVSFLLRSAFACSVSPPCLYCGWLAPRLIASSFLAPWYLHTAMPYAAGLRQRSPRALHFAVQRLVLPEMMFGRGIGKFSYNTSAEERGGWAQDFMGADLIETSSVQAHQPRLRRSHLWR